MPAAPKLPQPKPKSSFMYLVAAAFLITSLFIFYNSKNEIVEKVPLSAIIQQAKDNKIESVKLSNDEREMTIRLKGETKKVQSTVKESSIGFYELMKNAGVPEESILAIKFETEETADNFWSSVIITLLPFLLILGLFAFILHRAQSGNNQALSFGKSTARLSDQQKQKTTFKDVAGAKEPKEELIEIVDFLKNPTKYTKMGAKIPKGVLVIGPPGTGKTLLARAVAGEANVPFFNISGSEFVEMFVGVGASRVRDLFKKAKRNAPCIIFIDEIDAVGRQRGTGLGGGHDEREQTLNQILTEMDGFEQDTNVIVMAATNRPDVLDPALLRPGRFDRRVIVDLPTLKEREAILKVHSRKKPLAKEVDLMKVARQTPGFAGADLENIMNEGAIFAARENKKQINQHDLELAVEKVTMGPERKSRVLSDQEKEITAYHETGHAIVGHVLPNCDPVHKLSIVSRGRALGVTWFLPEADKHLYSKSKFEDELCSLLGGRAAEALIYGEQEITTGASNDLERASEIARKMVTVYGMSSLGPVTYGEQNHEIFLGRDLGHVKNYSEETAKDIDEAVTKILTTAYKKTVEILKKHSKELEKVAKDLLKKETLSAKEFAGYFPNITKKTSSAKA